MIQAVPTLQAATSSAAPPLYTNAPAWEDGFHIAGLRRLLVLIFPATLLVLAAYSNTAMSQPTDELQPQFAQVIIQVRRADAAGATSTEVAELLVLLNRALQLNDQALRLTRPNDAQRRAELLANLDEMLDSVQAKANQLESVAAQRTFTNICVQSIYEKPRFWREQSDSRDIANSHSCHGLFMRSVQCGSASNFLG